jgi:hypothetical protein
MRRPGRGGRPAHARPLFALRPPPPPTLRRHMTRESPPAAQHRRRPGSPRTCSGRQKTCASSCVKPRTCAPPPPPRHAGAAAAGRSDSPGAPARRRTVAPRSGRGACLTARLTARLTPDSRRLTARLTAYCTPDGLLYAGCRRLRGCARLDARGHVAGCTCPPVHVWTPRRGQSTSGRLDASPPAPSPGLRTSGRRQRRQALVRRAHPRAHAPRDSVDTSAPPPRHGPCNDGAPQRRCAMEP